MIFFASGNESEVENVRGLFAKLSLGNIGEDEGSCSTFSYSRKQRNNNMTLSCSYGKINSIYGYGLEASSSTVKCETGQLSLDFIDKDCRNSDLFLEGSQNIFVDHFNSECVN